TGLYYFHARFYDPEVGRFVGRDPVREYGGEIYSLAYNIPTKNSDPTGRYGGCGGCIRYPPGGPEPNPFPDPPTPGRCRNGRGATNHGNYCGEQAPGDFTEEYLRECPPINDLDKCCFEHDLCYQDAGVSWDFSFPTGERKKCDRDLCECTRASFGGSRFYAYLLDLLFSCSCLLPDPPDIIAFPPGGRGIPSP
ncbi:MAG: hypothetical protein KC964_22010, partial [Candidatus Omnitrophica bacterium]|nr:hypothetical protein [Candidatus Omnitrophota bacterium]